MITTQTPYRKKLIEVELPLGAINECVAREQMPIRRNHPWMIHTWWARRPVAACRAVVFATMVDDPSACPEEFPDLQSQTDERQRLHDIMTELVKWENTNDDMVIASARTEIARSIARQRDEKPPTDATDISAYILKHAPTVFDPFSGGGLIPLEAQRLGFKVYGSDLNPVATMITKSLVELPHKFAGRTPINPDAEPLTSNHSKSKSKYDTPWRGTSGIAADIRYYGEWLRDQLFERVGHLYPQAELSDGSKASVIAWLWARNIPCPNPACDFRMPLMKNFQLSKRKNNLQWVRPIIDRKDNAIKFNVQDNDHGVPKKATVNRT